MTWNGNRIDFRVCEVRAHVQQCRSIVDTVFVSDLTMGGKTKATNAIRHMCNCSDYSQQFPLAQRWQVANLVCYVTSRSPQLSALDAASHSSWDQSYCFLTITWWLRSTRNCAKLIPATCNHSQLTRIAHSDANDFLINFRVRHGSFHFFSHSPSVAAVHLASRS